MSASLVSFLIDHLGKKTFLQQYNNWIPSEKELQSLEPKWQRYLAKEALKHPKKKREKPAIKSRAGSENDQGVVHSAFEAKKRGIQSLLKPQVFFGNSWPGALEYENEADWDAFFDYYYRWIRHYAFLAEIHQIDALSMGVEFVKATLSHSEQWKEMFQKTRGLYQGNLTYAPIVFTEIGFRSIEMPWKNPHANGDTPFNEEHQQRCYEVIFEGIQNEPWCAGILWWKFPSYLEYRGTENTAFTPNNKATEATVRKWFSE